MVRNFSVILLVAAGFSPTTSLRGAGEGFPQPIAAYLLDEGTGRVAKDSQRNAHGTIHGGETNIEWVQSDRPGNSGPDDYALAFKPVPDAGVGSDGDTYIDCGNPRGHFDLVRSMTSVGWVKPRGPGGGNGWIWVKQGQRGAGAASWGAAWQDAEQSFLVPIGIRTTECWQDRRPPETNLPRHKWHHIAQSYDAAIGRMNFYLNGEEIHSEGVGRGGICVTDGPFSIGHENTWGQENLSGAVDEIAVFDVALTQAQVQQVMNDGLASIFELAADEPDRAQVEHFENKVRPLLAAHCWSCHGKEKQEAGLRLDTAEGLRRGLDTEPVVVPGKPDESRLIQAVRRTGDIPMPPKKALSEAEVAALVAWVADGAVWPASGPTRLESPPGGPLFTADEKSYWAFQPISDPKPPKVERTDWAQTDIDRFILAGLEAKGLSPAAPADKGTLLRRLTFDMTGLPPTPREMEEFLADESPEAFSKVVQRLLKSPHYGERWGKRWLDVVRYSDTSDIGGRFILYDAYRYRDYVVRSFNRDKRFDEFVIEQLAGDLLPPTKDLSQVAERVIATGYLLLGPKPVTEIDKEKMILEIVDEQVNVTGRAFLGMTVACARCHSHKFDPIPTEDYYSLAGIFYSTRTMADRRRTDSMWMERTLMNVPGEKKPVRVLAVEDGKPTNLRVHIRGSHFNLGEVAPRRFLQIIAGENHAPIDTEQSGRLELARWIASPDHPLTARVMVNRIWQGHFGTGIVPTSDNFGVTGQRPTHPELLDWLTSRFLESGWSVKAMHRLMLNTNAYRMGGGDNDKTLIARQIDPDNTLLWRMNPRRLEAEEIRDAMLAASGQLDLTLGGTIYVDQMRYVDAAIDPKRGIFSLNLIGRTYQPYYSSRRSIYLPLIPQLLPTVFSIFDIDNPSALNTKRNETTVAPQALFSMNSPFVRQQSLHFARQLLRAPDTSDADRVRIARQKVLGRLPTESETAAAIDYVSQMRQTLDKAGRARANVLPDGATLTVTIERSRDDIFVHGDMKHVLDSRSDVWVRLSVTSVDRVRANRNHIADWTVLTPVRTESTGGAALSIEPNGTIKIEGKNPTPDTYTIDAHTDLKTITAVRLEVFPDPEEAPNRFAPELFVVREFNVHASLGASTPAARTQEIRVQNATLKSPDADMAITPTIDANPNTSWPVGPRRDSPGVVIFETEDSHLTAWQSYCRALFSLNEFVYLE